MARPSGAERCAGHGTRARPPHLHSLEGTAGHSPGEVITPHAGSAPHREGRSGAWRAGGGSVFPGGERMLLEARRGRSLCSGRGLPSPPRGSLLGLLVVWRFYWCTVSPHQPWIPYLWMPLCTKMYSSPQARAHGACAHYQTHTCARAKSLLLYPTLCDPMDPCPPCSSVHGVLQSRILENLLLQAIFSTQESNLHLLRLLHW